MAIQAYISLLEKLEVRYQGSQNKSNLSKSADETSHLHHVSLKPFQRNNMCYGTNANRIWMRTHMWQNCMSGQCSHHVSLHHLKRKPHMVYFKYKLAEQAYISHVAKL